MGTLEETIRKKNVAKHAIKDLIKKIKTNEVHLFHLTTESNNLRQKRDTVIVNIQCLEQLACLKHDRAFKSTVLNETYLNLYRNKNIDSENHIKFTNIKENKSHSEYLDDKIHKLAHEHNQNMKHLLNKYLDLS